MVRKNLTYVLAGGRGSRLFPLTKSRAKPAVPFGGTRRVIDFVLSNLYHSGIRRIDVLTQYESASLGDYIRNGWDIRFGVGVDDCLRHIPTRETMYSGWTQGNAEAVIHNMERIKWDKPELVNIFGADHIYVMDVSQMNDFHFEKNSDLTVSVIPVKRNLAAKNYGVLEVNNNWQIKGFEEKPEDPKPMPGNKDYCLASMGNYTFNPDVLLEFLIEDSEKEFTNEKDLIISNPDHFTKHDFGFDIVPPMIKEGKNVFAYNFLENTIPGQKDNEKGYWRDIGNIEQFYKANMEIISSNPPINLYNDNWKILTYVEFSSPAKFEKKGNVLESVVANGSRIINADIEKSVISYATIINDGAKVTNSVLMGRNEVGKGAVIKNAIIDKWAKIPAGETVGVDEKKDRERGFYEYSSIPVVAGDFKF